MAIQRHRQPAHHGSGQQRLILSGRTTRLQCRSRQYLHVRLGIGYNGAKSELNNSGGVLGVGNTLTVTGGGTVERSVAFGLDNATGADTFSTLAVTGGTTYKFLNDVNLGATNSTLTLNGG